jgi:hypothetical protein
MNAFQRKHAYLGRRAAWRGKTANLAAGRKDPVAGDDQRDRIPGHGLTDIARSFWPGTKLLRDDAIGRRAAPSDPPRRGINLLEERVLLPRSSVKPKKSVSSPSKYRFTAATASTTSGVGAPRSAQGNRRNRARSAASALFVGN